MAQDASSQKKYDCYALEIFCPALPEEVSAAAFTFPSL